MVFFENWKKLKEETKELIKEQESTTRINEVYKKDKYKDNKKQLKTDFNKLDWIDRDISEISKQNPNFIFLFNENNEIIDILDE